MTRVLFYSVIILLLLSGCTSKAIDAKEAATNDSIQKYLDLAVNDSLDFKLRNKYNDIAVSFLDLRKNDTLTRLYIYKININLSRLGKAELLKKFSTILIEKSIKVKDSVSLYRGHYGLGYSFMLDSKNELAIKSFFKAKKGFSSYGLVEEELGVMRNIALTQSFANDFLGSINTSFEIIKKSKKHNLRSEINNAYLSIGNNFSYLKNEKKAIYYYKKVEFDKTDFNSISALNTNIANSYIQLGEFDEAFLVLKKYINTLRFKQKTKSNGTINSLIGLYFLKIKRPQKSYFFLKRADDIFKSIEALNGENYNQIYFSEYYAQLNDTLNAIKAANKAVTLSRSYKNPADVLLSLQQMIKVDKKLAFQHAQAYIRINDSLQIAERKFRDKFAEIRFGTEEITQEKDTAIKQKWIIVAISGVAILIVILLLIITRQRSKQKELQLVQSQQNANEEIYNLMLTQKTKEDEARQNEKKRIALELHDGVMNKLASTRLNLDILHHKNDEQTIKKCLIHVAEIYKIEQEIRNIAHDLNLQDFNFSNGFATLVKDFIITQNNTSRTQYKLEIDKSINWEGISSNIKMNVFRIIQEASHNINNSAQAKNAVISLMFDNSNLCLSITDDGKGFDPEINSDGIGLKNIQQRVDSLNGKFVIQSIKNKSTSLNIAIPIK